MAHMSEEFAEATRFDLKPAQCCECLSSIGIRQAFGGDEIIEPADNSDERYDEGREWCVRGVQDCNIVGLDTAAAEQVEHAAMTDHPVAGQSCGKVCRSEEHTSELQSLMRI